MRAPPTRKSEVSTGWRSGGGMSLDRNRVDKCAFSILEHQLETLSLDGYSRFGYKGFQYR